MAKKKVKKSPVKRKVKNASSIKPTKNKIRLVLRDLLLFVILTLISYMIYSVSESDLYISFFGVISLVLGFISLAFFIVLLVLLFLKILKR